MSEPEATPVHDPSASAGPAAPFDPPTQGGCGKPLLVMGAAVLALALAALVIFALKAGPLLALTFRTVAPAITGRLADEVSAEERRRLEAAFEAAAVKAESGDLDQELLLVVQGRIAALAGAEEIGSEEAAALAADLEALAGLEPQTAPEEPPPGPSGEADDEPSGRAPPEALEEPADKPPPG